MEKNNVIFVFGSNLAGRHGKGAALYAKENYGAVYGKGWGRMGMSYGIPTKDEHLRSLPLSIINRYVNDFLNYAIKNPDLEFKLTAIGTGLAGYSPHEIGPMFKSATKNIIIPLDFLPYV